MASLAPLHWHADCATLGQALTGARSVQTTADPHISALLAPQVAQRRPQALFADVNSHCRSFSTWWNRSTRGMKTLNDLPGLAALADSGSAGPLFDALTPAKHTPFEYPK
jgi:deoxyribodipyrimidine photo-lyase